MTVKDITIAASPILRDYMNTKRMWCAWLRLRRPIMGTSIAAILLLLLPSCKKKEQEGGAVARPANALELVFTYGSEKEKWINEVTNDFNRAEHRTSGGKPIYVRAVPMGSGE